MKVKRSSLDLPVGSLRFSVPFTTDTLIVTIRMGFENRQPRLVVDKGDPDLVLFESRLPETTGLQTLGTEEIPDVSGTFQRWQVRISEAYLGKEPLGAEVAFVVDDRKDDGDNFEGVLGMKGLSSRRLGLTLNSAGSLGKCLL